MKRTVLCLLTLVLLMQCIGVSAAAAAREEWAERYKKVCVTPESAPDRTAPPEILNDISQFEKVKNAEDLFYYRFTDETLNLTMENLLRPLYNAEYDEWKPSSFWVWEENHMQIDRDYNGANYVKPGENVDPRKISHGLDEIYCEYDWTPDAVYEFLKRGDKEAYLANRMKVKTAHIPLYYDGVKTDYMVRIAYDAEKDDYKITDTGSYHPETLKCYYKERLEKQLTERGFEGYRPILYFMFDDQHFAVAEKGREECLLFLSNKYYEDVIEMKYFESFKRSYGTLMQQGVIPPDRVREVLAEYHTAYLAAREAAEKERKENPGQLVGTVSGSDASAVTENAASDPKTVSGNTEEDTERSTGWRWLIPVIILLAAAAIGLPTFILLKKKDKS